MKAHKIKSGKEKYITNENGEVEYIILPVKKYKIIMDLIEDYGLGLAIKEAEKDRLYSRIDALDFLKDAKG